VDVAVYFHNQPRFVTVKVDNKSLNDLLPPKVDSQLIRPQFLPYNLLGGSHVSTQFTSKFLFFFRDLLTWDNVFDGHGMILIQNPTPTLPKWGRGCDPDNARRNATNQASRLSLVGRYPDVYCRSLVFHAFDLHPASQSFHNPIDDIQANTRALNFVCGCILGAIET